MNRLNDPHPCEFGVLIDYKETECSGPATVVAVVEFEDGQRETFNLCERCAQEDTEDPDRAAR